MNWREELNRETKAITSLTLWKSLEQQFAQLVRYCPIDIDQFPILASGMNLVSGAIHLQRAIAEVEAIRAKMSPEALAAMKAEQAEFPQLPTPAVEAFDDGGKL